MNRHLMLRQVMLKAAEEDVEKNLKKPAAVTSVAGAVGSAWLIMKVGKMQAGVAEVDSIRTAVRTTSMGAGRLSSATRAKGVAVALGASSRWKKFVGAAVATFTTTENSATGKEEEVAVATTQTLRSGAAMAKPKDSSRREI